MCCGFFYGKKNSDRNAWKRAVREFAENHACVRFLSTLYPRAYSDGRVKRASHQATHKLLNFLSDGGPVLWRVRAEFKTEDIDHAFPCVFSDHNHLHDTAMKELCMLNFLPNQRPEPLTRGGTEYLVNFNVAQESIFLESPDQRGQRQRIAWCAVLCIRGRSITAAKHPSVKWPPIFPTQLPTAWC